MKYKVGDKLKPKEGHEHLCGNYNAYNGEYIVITSFTGNLYIYEIYENGQSKKQCVGCFNDLNLEPYEEKTITNSKPNIMGRLKYELLKETPELKKGAIVEEMCDDGTQDFHSITKEHEKYGETEFSRDTVMKQPKWFRQVTPIYVAVKYLDKIKKAIKKIT